MGELSIITDTKISKLKLISKVYIWSVVMEPLYFFLLAPQNITGIGANFARILQFIVVASLCLKLFSYKRARITNFFSPLNKNFTYYFIFAVLAGFLGLYTGSYSFNIDFSNHIENNSIVADLIRGHSFRPFFEYFIAFYYFAYFVVLAAYMLASKEAIDYFFKLFFIAFLMCIFVGFLDLLLQLLIEGRDGFPRHLSDGRSVGFRFHGIAGEPRDACSYLMLSLGILALRDIWEDKKKLTLFWIILITTATLLTQSVSGILGLVFFGILVVIYYLPFTSLKTKLLFVSIALLITLLIVINISLSDRLMRYYHEFYWLYSLIELGPLTEIDWTSRCNLPNITDCDIGHGTDSNEVIRRAVFSGQMSNIYPIWHLWEEIKDFKFLHLFIGNGLGSSSIINSFYMHSNGLENPHAGIIRSLYETGIIGTLLFIAVFLTPIKTMYMNNNINSKLIIFMLLMLGMYFAHRSAIPYIFLGIALVVLNNKSITSSSISRQ